MRAAAGGERPRTEGKSASVEIRVRGRGEILRFILL